jgi:glycosyltransferase involved in cell wall biosynthesis
MPKVSVIIPAYNAMTYLPESVESVLNQTFTGFEVLIINDGSSDGIVEWAKRITDSRIRLISQENQGLAGARNTGIAHAQGEYLAFLDADDLWEATKLEKQVRCLEENLEVGLVDAWVVLADEHGKSIGRVIKSQPEGDVWKRIIECPTVVCGSSPMVRRCCFENLGVFARDLSGSADWDMWIRVASRYSFAVVKEPLVYYRQHPSSMSKNCQEMLRDNSTVIEKTFNSAPTELLYLKNRSYGHVNLYLSWRSLDNKNYQEAIYFRQQALTYYPQLFYSWNYIRQGIAIMVMRWLGPQGYSGARALIYTLRRRTSSVTQ